MSARLTGRTILVAASEDRVPRLAAALAERGATPIPFPTVRIVPPPDMGPFDEAIRRWRVYDWVVFTSTNGVHAVVARARALGVDLRSRAGAVAAVGPATKAAAEAAGLVVRAMPDEYVTAAIADALGDVCGRSVLLPRSSIARRDLAEDLRERGANVREVSAYEAVPAAPDLAALRAAPRIDLVLFTSASAARNLAKILPEAELERLRSTAEAACIGPVTAEAARDLGFRVAVVAPEHTLPGLVDMVEEAVAHG